MDEKLPPERRVERAIASVQPCKCRRLSCCDEIKRSACIWLQAGHCCKISSDRSHSSEFRWAVGRSEHILLKSRRRSCTCQSDASLHLGQTTGNHLWVGSGFHGYYQTFSLSCSTVLNIYPLLMSVNYFLFLSVQWQKQGYITLGYITLGYIALGYITVH